MIPKSSGTHSVTSQGSRAVLTNPFRIQVLLRFAYAHVQMMLYRPFLRRPPPQHPADTASVEVTHICQATGISVCRNIIHIGLEIRKQRVLIGPHWFMMYTEFLAVVSLILYVLNNPSGPACSEILADAQLGRAAIGDLTQRSLPADRVAAALDVSFWLCSLSLEICAHLVQCLFEKLPASLVPPAADLSNIPEFHLSSLDERPGLGTAETLVSDQGPITSLVGYVPASETNMFTAEDPFAYPHVEEFGMGEQREANMDQSTELPLFPDLCGVTEAELLDPLHLLSRDT
jgi:hypothetical protein